VAHPNVFFVSQCLPGRTEAQTGIVNYSLCTGIYNIECKATTLVGDLSRAKDDRLALHSILYMPVQRL